METQASNNQGRPQNKAELLERIDREWRALEQSFAGLNEQQMQTPDTGGWSIKDNLVHLSAWEEFMLLHYLGGIPASEAFKMDADFLDKADFNEINAVLFERNKERSLEDVLAKMRATHAQALASLGKVPFETMLQPRASDSPEQVPLLDEIIWNTYDHYREHRATIEKFATGTLFKEG